MGNDRFLTYLHAMGAWIDIHGRPKSKVVPIDHLPNLLAGSERYTPRGITGLGAMLPHEEECVAMPDVTTLRRMPWDDRFVWMAAIFSLTAPRHSTNARRAS